MQKFIVRGPKALTGHITVAGAKNVALKALVTSLLTDEELVIRNVPEIRDVALMLDVLKSLGVEWARDGHVVRVVNKHQGVKTVPLEVGARLRTSSMVLGPLLARYGEANIPNPGGCRIGARPIGRHIDGLRAMGADIFYDSADGFFHAHASGLVGVDVAFDKNTHTGTETLILAAVLANGTTKLTNAAEEVEVDDLIALLTAMGADIRRTAAREITIHGVPSLHGADYTIMPDRNEEVTFAVAAAASGGDITIHASQRQHLAPFLDAYTRAGGGYEAVDDTTTRYFSKGPLTAVDVTTLPHPGFMTDWQAPWSVLMTQASGRSTIHETVFESRFAYVEELRKMGAEMELFQPAVDNPESFYNFDWKDHAPGASQAVAITGPTPLHNAILTINDLRAGATLLLSAIIATGESTIHGIEQVDRGYEHIEERLCLLGADIRRVTEDDIDQ